MEPQNTTDESPPPYESPRPYEVFVTNDFSRPNPQLEYLAIFHPPARSKNGGQDLRRALSNFNKQQELRRLVLAIVYEFEEWGAIFPWANIVHRLNGGHMVSTVPDLKSMLVSLRAHLLEAGYVVPPHNHKGQEGFEPQTRGLYKSPAHEPQDPPRAIPFTGTNPIDGLFMPDDFAATMLTRAQLEDMDKCARRRGGEPLSSMDRHTAPPSGTTAAQDTSSSSQTNYQTPVGNDQQGLQRPAATTAMADYGQHDQHLHGSRRTLDANSRIFQERLKEAVSARDPERERDRRARNLRMELQSLARAHARPQALARRPPLQTTTQMPAQSTARTPAQSTTQAATLFRHLNEQDRRLVQAIHQALGFDVIGTHSNAVSSSGNGGPAGMDQQTPARSIQTQPSDQPSHTSQDRLNSIPEQRDATDSDQDMEEGM